MPSPISRNFSAGELSPAMYANADMARYQQGLKVLRNAIVLRTGGVQSRAGTEYLGTTKGNGVARLVPAVFDDDASYVLEFGDEYLRVWENGALVTIATPSAWVTATSYAKGVFRSNGGVNYYCTTAHTSGASTEPGVGASWQTRWHALTGLIWEIPTAYVEADLFELQFAYELNVVTIVHPSYPPARLTRVSDADWTLDDVAFAGDSQNVPTGLAVSGASGTGWGYAVTAIVNGVESVPSAMVRTNIDVGINPITSVFSVLAGAPRTVTWNPVTGATGYRVYSNTSSLFTTFFVVNVTGTTFVDNGSSYPQQFPSVSAPTSTGGFDAVGEYPAAVGAHQQRIIFGGSDNEPDVVYASQVARPTNFNVSDPLLDSDSLSWRQVGRRVNRVWHFAEIAQRLVQFSSVGESIIQGDTDGILRPGEVNPRQFSENGAASSPSPLVINDSALYVQARGSIVRDIAPIEANGFAGSDVTLQAAHLVDGFNIVDWCYQQTPDSVVWAVRDDGTLLSLTYVRELGVLGWATHDTDGTFESVCCVPENGRDTVYAVVNRNVPSYQPGDIGGSAVAYNDADYSASLGMILAVGASTARTSDDGETWDFSSVPSTSPTHNTWNFVRWCEAISRWVTVSTNANLPTPNAVSVGTSATGATWDGALLTSGDREWYGIADLGADDGTVVVFGTGNKAAATNDGISWSEYDTTGITNSLYNRPVYFSDSGRLIGMDVNRGLVYSDNLVAFSGVAGLQSVTIRGTWKSSTGRVFAPDTGIVNYSDDEGDTWSSVSAIASVGFDWMVFLSGGRIYAGNSNTNPATVAYSDDDGLTWVEAVEPDWPATAGSTIGVRKSDADQILLFANGDEDYTLTFPVTPRFVERFTDRLADVPVLLDAAESRPMVAGVVTGLEHLEGKDVSVINATTGVVLASPNNPAYSSVTVENGGFTITDGPAATVYVGLPYTTDIQTLDIDTSAGTLKPGKFLITSIGAWTEETMSFFVGPEAPTTANGLTLPAGGSMQAMQVLDRNENPVTTPQTGFRTVNFEGRWSDSGSIFIRNVDPTPLTVLALVPYGTYPR